MQPGSIGTMGTIGTVQLVAENPTVWLCFQTQQAQALGIGHCAHCSMKASTKVLYLAFVNMPR